MLRLDGGWRRRFGLRPPVIAGIDWCATGLWNWTANETPAITDNFDANKHSCHLEPRSERRIQSAPKSSIGRQNKRSQMQTFMPPTPIVILSREASEGSNQQERIQTSKASTKAEGVDIISQLPLSDCLQLLQNRSFTIRCADAQYDRWG